MKFYKVNSLIVEARVYLMAAPETNKEAFKKYNDV